MHRQTHTHTNAYAQTHREVGQTNQLSANIHEVPTASHANTHITRKILMYSHTSVPKQNTPREVNIFTFECSLRRVFTPLAHTREYTEELHVLLTDAIYKLIYSCIAK